jgi:3-hydroxymyristoyl/3-hydroxydecanoyl-(acyl carrier protein) dehydratase
VQHRPVERDAGTLTTQVKITGVSKSGGMIIQNFDYAVSDRHGLVYKGDTYFGFFSKEALRDQVGLRDIEIYQESTSGAPGIPGTPGESLTYPQHAPFPDDMMRMIDHIDQLVVDGGPNQLGYIRATKNVDPDDWFFKAHFYQDPVCPGSLGLESMLQLMKVLAAKRFGVSDNTRFESMVRGHSHQWVYRGQILPTDRQVTVSAIVTGIDESAGLVRCDGLLSVDGRHIYQMTDFTIKISP